MLLERDQVVVGALFAVLLAGLSVFAVTASDDLFRRGDDVVIELANAEGLRSGDDVLVAGLRAGTVRSVELAGGHVDVHVRFEAEVPRDSRARLLLRNLVGKRAIEIVTGDDWDHLLVDEERPRIPVDRTSGLIDVPELGDETVALLRDADTEALTVLVRSLADVTEGQHDEVGTLLRGLDRFAGVLAQEREALGTLVSRSAVLVDAAADRDEDLVTIIDRFGSTLDELATRREHLRRLLEATAGASALTADLIGDERERIDHSLAELHEVLEIVDRHQVDVAHTFAYGGVAFLGFSEVGRSGDEDTPFWGNILTQGIGPAGIDAFAGCGGVVDRFLDRIFGEAECPEREPGEEPSAPSRAAPDLGGFLGRGAP